LLYNLTILPYFRTSYEEENIYAKVDDMTYYPVVVSPPPPVVDTSTLPSSKQHASIINNFLGGGGGGGDQLATKTLNLHQGGEWSHGAKFLYLNLSQCSGSVTFVGGDIHHHPSGGF
jgi:hypothetical protein